MARTTPRVEDATLVAASSVAEAIVVGTPAWYAWLEQATTFAFAGASGRFTARKERRGQTVWYWKAYRKRAGLVRSAYLGKSADLTLERLNAIATDLAQHATAPPAAESAGALDPVPAAVDSTSARLTSTALPTGTLTFLFTDIEGSTTLWEQHPHAMPAALARHDAILHAIITAHHGVVFKTVGDGTHAVFATAPDALGAALSSQRALHAEPWEPTSPLRVRMALHTGVAAARDGDYYGAPLNRVARILALGHGAQILLSHTTHDLVADDLPAQTTLRDLGEYHLKDLSRPEQIFQLMTPDLPTDFPPLRTLDAHPAPAPIQPLDLLGTKLYVPIARPQLVPRPRLLARLAAALAGKLTLLSAPAGFGKTTLLTSWIADCRLQIADYNDPNLQSTIYNLQSPQVAWVSLDADDNNAPRFWRYVIAALDMLQPDIGATALALLQSPQPPPIETMLTPLLNALSSLPTDVVLVLDDYHLIDALPIHTALAFLLDHLPPRLHLVLTTRADPPLPLTRLRARGQLTELRAADLRFTTEETAAFLTELMGLPLSAGDIAALEARTEGWIAGLQFAALAMRDRSDYASFIAAFTGSNRFVVDYLADEVLNRLPAHLQTFLLRTSILERMCGPLCDAVLGVGRWELGGGEEAARTNPQLPSPNSLDSYSQLLLEQLERANLFVTPLDAERRWYRYHHLFAEVLRERLRRGAATTALATLHRRASAWYEQASFTSQAVQHALAAQAFGRAAALVEQVAPAMIQRTELAKLLTWLDALPADEVQARPLLGLYYGWGLFLSGQMKQAATRLEAIEAVLATDEAKQTSDVQGHAAAMRAYLVRETGDFAATIALSRQALAHLPEQDSLLRAMVTLNLAIAHYLQGEFGLASQLLTETIATGQTAQRMANTLSAMYLNAQLLRAQGALQQALQLCQDGLELVARYGWNNFPAVGFLYVAFGDVLREHNELSTAAEYLEKGIKLGQEGGHPHILIIGHVWLAWLRQTQGDVTGSHAAIRVALQLVQQYQVSSFWPLPSAACYQARLWIAQGNLAAASHWGQTSRLNQAGTPGAYLFEVEYVTLTRLLIVQGNLDAAEALLLRLHHSAASAGRSGSLIEILILQAITCAAQKRGEAALSALAQALRLAEPEGFVRIFLDEGAPMARLLQAAQTRGIAPNYIETLLAAFPRTEGRELRNEFGGIGNSVLSPRPSALVDPLSDRELEILRLIADGLSNQAIADRLVIAVSTVKKHVNNIYGKLDVQSRTQALVRARELHLL